MPAPQNSLCLSAPAKLNLFLHITGRREDGYHLLQTLFQLLDYDDTVELEVRDDAQIVLSHPMQGIPSEENLVVRAAKALRAATGCTDGCRITLHKNLPIGAGLGGGSSDAATTLVGLNRLWGCRLSLVELAQIGVQLGADIPVFVHGQTAWGEGIGEQLSPMTLPSLWYLVVMPNVAISTRQIFSHPELTRNSPPLKICALEKVGILRGAEHKNDCQALVEQLYGDVREVVEWLRSYANPMMTGTGSAIFCAFKHRKHAETILKKVPPVWKAFIAKGVNRSRLHEQVSK